MKISMNLTAIPMDLDRFADKSDLHHFYADKGIDGIELLMCGEKTIPEKITAEEINGIHLRYYHSWLDFWQGSRRALEEEFGSEDVWTMFYGTDKPEGLLPLWEEELELAHRIGARYVVFHVSECVLEECITYKFRHTDEEVVDAACDVINRLLDGKPYKFHFLVENLWWSGLTLTRPEIVQRMMDGIHYANKGIMLDTGHLMHTNNSIRTQEEGVAYIHSVLDRLGPLCSWIKGIHLNMTLSGEYVESVIRKPFSLTGDYWNRMNDLYPHIFRIDSHRPFTADGVAPLIRRIAPEYVTYELITTSREEHEAALIAQVEAIAKNGGIR